LGCPLFLLLPKIIHAIFWEDVTIKYPRCNRRMTIVSLTTLILTCLVLAAAPPVVAMQKFRILVEGVPMRGTANGMDYWTGFLYLPRFLEGRVVKVEISTGSMTDITTGWGVPAATHRYRFSKS
jgi:hypothetical protein